MYVQRIFTVEMAAFVFVVFIFPIHVPVVLNIVKAGWNKSNNWRIALRSIALNYVQTYVLMSLKTQSLPIRYLSCCGGCCFSLIFSSNYIQFIAFQFLHLYEKNTLHSHETTSLREEKNVRHVK